MTHIRFKHSCPVNKNLLDDGMEQDHLVCILHNRGAIQGDRCGFVVEQQLLHGRLDIEQQLPVLRLRFGKTRLHIRSGRSVGGWCARCGIQIYAFIR